MIYNFEARGLTKQFYGQTAVQDVFLRIRENTVYGLLRPNGAEKTTALKMLFGLLCSTERYRMGSAQGNAARAVESRIPKDSEARRSTE